MNLRKQSDTTYPIPFFMADVTDHTTGKTGLSPTVTISKNGGAFASPSGAVTEIGVGWYKVAGNATDSNTLGPLLLHATATGADTADANFAIVSHDPFVAGTAQTGDAYAVALIACKILKNRTETNPATGVMTVYDDDGTTPLYTANIFEDVAGATAYDGTAGVNRRNALA